jgi:hypothetical protein
MEQQRKNMDIRRE